MAAPMVAISVPAVVIAVVTAASTAAKEGADRTSPSAEAVTMPAELRSFITKSPIAGN